jgi:S1-C subfamily serine protease
MSARRTLPAVLATAFALLFFGLGNFLGARQNADTEQLAKFDRMEQEIAQLKRRTLDTAGTAGRTTPAAAGLSTEDPARASIVADIKRQLQDEMGLLPLTLLRDRSASFVELYSYDDHGSSSYGTAGYLGEGYFITVKHGVVALNQEGQANPRTITSVKLMYKGQMLNAKIVDAGDAKVEVDPGDWAIVKVKEPIDMPALSINLGYGFEFADPIFRLGNDYSKGIILSTGYVGQRTTNKLVTCLTDGHPGVSGGGVLNREGELVGIPIGRMQGDFRFSFILPLRSEMFRKVSHLN